MYMAFNHNGTPLMRQPGTKEEAEKELKEYTRQTGNDGYVDELKWDKDFMEGLIPRLFQEEPKDKGEMIFHIIKHRNPR